MTKYVALLRGIGPSNPNMHSAPLKGFFESLGFKNVATVISSGNVVFESASNDIPKLESKIEKALPKGLGFKSSTIIRSEAELKKLVAKDPFKGIKDEKPNYLVVTFFKNKKSEIPTVIDQSTDKTPDFMAKIEKQYGKEITTRTWKTVHRILKAMEK